MRIETFLLITALVVSACAKKSSASAPSPPVVADQEVALGPGQTFGKLDKDLIADVIKGQMPTIRQCYEKPLARDRSLGGRVAIRFMIAENGSVSAAQVTKDEVRDPAVSRCVLTTFRQMKFPEPSDDGVVIVTYPLLFAAE